MPQNKYGVYHSLRLALSRNNFKKRPGVLATYLLDIFLGEERQIRAPQVYTLGLCEDGKFKEWRKNLCDQGWLKFQINHNRLSSIKYNPGYKLVPYLNREKFEANKSEFVTRNELEFELKRTNARLDILDEKIGQLIQRKDPPDSEEKREKFATDQDYSDRLLFN